MLKRVVLTMTSALLVTALAAGPAIADCGPGHGHSNGNNPCQICW